jgi:hypothetical protein
MDVNSLCHLTAWIMSFGCIVWMKFEPDPEKKVYLAIMGVMGVSLWMVWPGWWK